MEDITSDPIWDLTFAFWKSKTLMSAVELDVFSRLDAEPMDAERLRAALGLHPSWARDFFDALVAMKMLERKDGVYRTTPHSSKFLVKGKASYVGGRVENFNRLYGFWHNLTEGLKTGRPQNEAKNGRDVFGEIYADPERLKLFCRGMSGGSMAPAQALAEKFPWREYKSVIDVGTAQGCLPTEIAKKHAHLRGGGFDLPAVRPVFEEYVGQLGLQDRLQFYPGNFFHDPLPTADVLVMGHVLHCWKDETKMMLLKKAFAALPSKGAIVVYDTLIDDDRRENAFAMMMSLTMLIETGEGTDYTGADCQRWMREAGFTDTRVQHLTGPHSMVVGIKP